MYGVLLEMLYLTTEGICYYAPRHYDAILTPYGYTTPIGALERVL